MTARRASLMVTCLGDLFFPEVGVSIVRLLRKLGLDARFSGRNDIHVIDTRFLAARRFVRSLSFVMA